MLKGMCWYLDGYSLERQDFRLFKLTRMYGITLSDICFTPREHCTEAVVQPDFQDKNLVTVTLRVKENAMGRLEEKSEKLFRFI